MRSRNVLVALLALIAMLAYTGSTITATASIGSGAHQAKAKGKAKGKAGKKKKKAAKRKKKKAPDVNVTGGTVTLTPSAASTAALTEHKVSTTVVAPAIQAGEALTLPIGSGMLNPTNGYGLLTLSGGYAYTETSSLSVGGLGSFTSGSEAAFADLTISIGASSQLSATIGNPPTNAPFFALKGINPVKSASALTITAIQANLTAPAAQLLNSFGGSAFKTEGNFGTIAINATI